MSSESHISTSVFGQVASPMSSTSHISTSVIGEVTSPSNDVFDNAFLGSPRVPVPTPSSPAASWITTSDVDERQSYERAINAEVSAYAERTAYFREIALRFYAHLFVPYCELLDELRARADAGTLRILRVRLETLSDWYVTRNAAEAQMECEFRRIEREHEDNLNMICRSFGL